jgi:hypothetical protein
MVGLVHGANDSKAASFENLSTRVARQNHIRDQLRGTVELRYKYGCIIEKIRQMLYETWW